MRYLQLIWHNLDNYGEMYVFKHIYRPQEKNKITKHNKQVPLRKPLRI